MLFKMKTGLCLRLFCTASMVLSLLIGCTDENQGPIASLFFAERDANDTLGIVIGRSPRFSRFVVISDNNKDGICNPGETVNIVVYVRNLGTSDIGYARARVSSTEPFVTFRSYGWADLGTLPAMGREVPAVLSSTTSNMGNYLFYSTGFTISSSTPSGYALKFTLEIESSSGSWEDAFVVQAQRTAATIKFSRYQIVKDNNSNGNPNPGETVYLRVFLKNIGTSQANGVQASFSSASSNVSALSPTSFVTYGTIPPNAAEMAAVYSYVTANDGTSQPYTFRFTISSTTQVGSTLRFTVNIQDAESNMWTDTFDVQTK